MNTPILQVIEDTIVESLEREAQLPQYMVIRLDESALDDFLYNESIFLDLDSWWNEETLEFELNVLGHTVVLRSDKDSAQLPN